MEQKHLPELLPAYLDGTLDDVSQQKLETALAQSPVTQKLLTNLQIDEKRWRHDRANLETLAFTAPPVRSVLQQTFRVRQIAAQRVVTRRLALGGLSATVISVVLLLVSFISLAASVPPTIAPTNSAGGGGFVTQDVPPPTVTPQEGIINYLTFPPNPTLPSDLEGKKLKKEEIKLIWPVRGEIAKRFGDAVQNGTYSGMSILAAQGTPIIAVMDGIVAMSGWDSGFGYSVRIRHAVNFETLYAHLNEPSTLIVGQKVQRGQVIGYLGSSGPSSGPHLLFRTELDGKVVDPLQFLP